MQITVVAVMCHTIGASFPMSVGTLPDPICREVIVIKDDMPMEPRNVLPELALADWKGRSIYLFYQWRISRDQVCSRRLRAQEWF